MFLLQITLLLTLLLTWSSELLVDGCDLEVTQPQKFISVVEHGSVSISCNISYPSMPGCDGGLLKVVWYVFTSDSHRELDTKNQPIRFQQKMNELQISDVIGGDGGVYYCAVISPREQAIGGGTTLTVREPVQFTGKAVLLTLLILLTLYNITILTYIICIKAGRGRFWRNDSKIDSSKKVHFGAVVQELYSRKNFHKKSITGDTSPQNKIESPNFQTEREDIYQNLKRTG